ncbi:3'-5' exoribonuclease [Pseudomonas juntendi]|uniref:3'-5' exoribonuclease n=1 Tax=Pseudomonas juntendi TaxID=2666183 RepID=UPI0018D66829|nr:3'-5' exoribonuclease [Pseudomonas juntendi]MBH3384684.1 3'-5' exoribonuclease [Pseudomonas juntendi]MDG9917851.1 3'-5' exoribonuclease [Pseudomonas juntendi]MDH0506312.1 3'-5' exoribonuclease [Pseudomonas juntendi]MDH1044566.1 3'-5' exoribonuclease [Pseudomonas juntendi]
MKLFLDTEFTQLNISKKLISLALVAENEAEFYVEFTDTYTISDCSEFVINTVLPQLDAEKFGVTFAQSQEMLAAFLCRFDEQVEICSDAPAWDWDFFVEMVYKDGKWPSNVSNRPVDISRVFDSKDPEVLVELRGVPHHALLDARILAKICAM